MSNSFFITGIIKAIFDDLALLAMRRSERNKALIYYSAADPNTDAEYFLTLRPLRIYWFSWINRCVSLRSLQLRRYYWLRRMRLLCRGWMYLWFFSVTFVGGQTMHTWVVCIIRLECVSNRVYMFDALWMAMLFYGMYCLYLRRTHAKTTLHAHECL